MSVRTERLFNLLEFWKLKPEKEWRDSRDLRFDLDRWKAKASNREFIRSESIIKTQGCWSEFNLHLNRGSR